MQKPKITVVLPIYNGEAHLKESIESILNQTFQNFELIVVDDGSIDATSKIIEKYKDSDPRIIVFRNEVNLKLPESLNRGFSQARGEYWTWTSCDNRYLPDALERLLEEIELNKTVGLVYASMQIINEMGEVGSLIEAGLSKDLILRNVVGACFLYRADVAKKIGFYNKDMFLCEDYEYWLRMASTITIKPINQCLYQYRRHAKSLSYNHEKEIIEKGIRVQKYYYPFFVKTRKDAAIFYAYLRDRDIYNPFRQLYLLLVLAYSPTVFFKEVFGLLTRRL